MSEHLVNMRLSKKEAKEEFEPKADDRPRFPHGLTIRLDDDSLKKLGITELPAVGDEMIVAGIGKIESSHENSRQSGIDRSVSIQLEKLAIGPLDGNTDHNTGHTAVGAVSKAIKDA